MMTTLMQAIHDMHEESRFLASERFGISDL